MNGQEFLCGDTTYMLTFYSPSSRFGKAQVVTQTKNKYPTHS